ncbi:MAG: sugar kinase [Pseudomonadota bacterium]
MQPASENNIVLVVRQTRLDGLIARFNTLEQARFYIEQGSGDFADYLAEHERYQQAVTLAHRLLAALGRVHQLEREFLPNYLFGPGDLVVVVGQDGLVVNTLKYLKGQRLIGINPDPQRWDGVLLPFKVRDLPRVVIETFAGRRPVREVTMAQARLDDGQTLYAVNDLFIGPRSHSSIRYRIETGGVAEEHSSSGVIVSTGLGSTGWLKSLLTGAQGIAAALTGAPHPENFPPPATTPWDAPYLHFTVREPFPSRTSTTRQLFGQVTAADPLILTSRLPEQGVIFSDGIESDFLAFNAGTRAVISVADKRGYLVG